MKQLSLILKSKSKRLYLLVSIFWIVILLLIWNNAPALLPKPMDVFNQIIDYLKLTPFDSDFPFVHNGFYSEIFASLGLTTKAMLCSIVISSLLAYSYTAAIKIQGILIRPFKILVDFIIKLRFMSILGFLFVFMSCLHEADKVKNALLVFSIVPFFTLSLVSTINRIQQKEYDLWTTLKYNRWRQLYEIIIYGKADYVIEAIGVNFAMGWIMMTLAESKSMADGGLGVLLFKADKYNDLVKVFALQIIIFIIGIMADYLIKQLRYKLFPYTALAEKK